MYDEIDLAKLPDVIKYMSQHINEYVAMCNDMYLQ